MPRLRTHDSHLPLLTQLHWFIGLRWVAGATVILVGVANQFWLGWFAVSWGIGCVGTAVLLNNLLQRLVLSRRPDEDWRLPALVSMASTQIVVDLLCLTLLILWTGSARSPVLGFSVFHMVIASLLLPRWMAYAGAGVSASMLAGGLYLTGQFPYGLTDALIVAGWIVTLLGSVYLTSNVTRSLRKHQYRVLRQSHRLRAISRKLRRQEEMIIQQDKMAAMGRMAAGVAHEIANPLANMNSLMQLVQRKPERLAGDTMDQMKQQVERISQTVRQLTHFAHPPDPRWRMTAVDAAVDHALQMVRFDPRVRDVRISVRRNLPEGGVYVKARPHAIEQVLVNVVLNAIDAVGGQADPQVEVILGQEAGRCTIEVADNGHGIAPENMSRVFEPFFTTKDVGEGTGLGLAISYSIVRDHRGKMDVQSSEEGTRFTISLPIESSQK